MSGRDERFASRLRGLRSEDDMSQRELADALGLTRASVVNYESGESMPNLAVAVQIADIFGVSLDYLVGASDDATRRRRR